MYRYRYISVYKFHVFKYSVIYFHLPIRVSYISGQKWNRLRITLASVIMSVGLEILFSGKYFNTRTLSYQSENSIKRSSKSLFLFYTLRIKLQGNLKSTSVIILTHRNIVVSEGSLALIAHTI